MSGYWRQCAYLKELANWLNLVVYIEALKHKACDLCMKYFSYVMYIYSLKFQFSVCCCFLLIIVSFSSASFNLI